MTQEDKKLLLTDLCARLPYGVKVEYKGEEYDVLGIAHGRLVLCKPFMSYTLNEHPLVEEVKPYLFPLSSMTEEQKRAYNMMSLGADWISNPHYSVPAYNVLDWLNENHLDYRDLIGKGLALDATGLDIY